MNYIMWVSLIIRSIMLFSCVNSYRIILIELLRYGLLLRKITFLLWIRENISLSCDMRRARVQRTWADMTWKPLFPDTSVWMTKSMIRDGYESQRTWMFIRGLLLTCTLIITWFLIFTDNGKTCLIIWQSGAMDRTFWNALF